MSHKITVVWGNIGDDNSRRLDHVTVESRDMVSVMGAAFEIVFSERESEEGRPLTELEKHELRHETQYDGFAVFDGHLTEAPFLGFF